ncbi:hypothetical protein BKA70DRAFT_747515 [Coprinopsis sp. MPI-PUGE-AT-0042]|nr:hypothetical protein BKA70DRAFT_747515 [Coprinopsis sp. MPI-PUGE-AT-0042]
MSRTDQSPPNFGIMSQRRNLVKALRDWRSNKVLNGQTAIEALNADSYSIEALDIVLEFFRSDSLMAARKKASTSLMQDDMERGIGFLATLKEMLTVSFDTGAHRSETALKLPSHLPDIYRWMNFLLDNLDPWYNDQGLQHFMCELSRVLCIIIDFDPRVGAAVVTSCEGVRLVLKFLSKKKKGVKDETYLAPSLNFGDSMTALLDRLLSSEDGRTATYDILLNSPKDLARFAQGFISRIRHLNHLDALTASKPGFSTFADFGKHVVINMYHVQKVLIENTVIHGALRKAGLLAAWLNTFPSLFPAETDRFPMLGELIQLAISHNQNPIRGVTTLVEKGVIQQLIRAMLAMDLGPNGSKDLCEVFLCQLGAYFHHPRILRAFKDVLATCPPEDVVAAIHLPHVGSRWGNMVGSTRNNIQTLNELKRGGQIVELICDNMTQNHSFTFAEAKACAKCGSVVYCSAECQQSDWKCRHFKECNIMEYSHRERKLYNFHLGLESRIFQMVKARQGLKITFNTLEQHRHANLNGPFNEFIYNVDFRTGYPKDSRISLIPISGYHLHCIKADCPATEARAQQLVYDFRSAPNTFVRLLDIQLAWSHAIRIGILFELELRGGEWEIGRSVVRVQEPSLHQPKSLFETLAQRERETRGLSTLEDLE